MLSIRERIINNDLYNMIDSLRKNYHILEISTQDGEEVRFFVVESFTPYNPSNHFHNNDLKGKNICKLLLDHAILTSYDPNVFSLITDKIEKLPTESLVFSHHYKFIWYKKF